jgi:hypothetical protein
MSKFLKQQQRYIWIALLAILFNALAPTVSHALAWSSSAPYSADICSASSPPADGDLGQKAPAQLPHAMKHCLMCAIHGGADGLPPASSTLLIGESKPIPPTVLPYPAYDMPQLWGHTEPRAPPSAT